jgi:hypothetical protein
MQTSNPVPQSVRFYKIVALSFLFLTAALLGVITLMSSKKAIITVMTKDTPVDVDLVYTLGKAEVGSISGVMASTTISLSKEYSPTGTKTEPGTATGFVTIHNESNSAQPLVATTRLLTPDQVLFRIKNNVNVPANGSIKAEVYADKQGEGGNIGPIEKFTIPGLNSERQKVVYASSDKQFDGGIKTIGVLNLSDIEKAEKQLKEDMLTLAKDQLNAKYPEMKGVFDVAEFIADTKSEIGKETSSFKLDGKATVVGVFYDKSEIDKIVSQQFAKRVIDDTAILTPGSEIAVTLGDYNLEKSEANLNVHASGTAKLNPDSAQLQKSMFFGKSKEDARRYVLSLDNVYSVDIKLSPLWVRSVPFVPDHVQIIVKTVQ